MTHYSVLDKYKASLKVFVFLIMSVNVYARPTFFRAFVRHCFLNIEPHPSMGKLSSSVFTQVYLQYCSSLV